MKARSLDTWAFSGTVYKFDHEYDVADELLAKFPHKWKVTSELKTDVKTSASADGLDGLTPEMKKKINEFFEQKTDVLHERKRKKK